MIDEVDAVELFLLKGASIKLAVEEANSNPRVSRSIAEENASVKASVSQFSAEVRDNAVMMAEHYKLFYMLENDIRRLIDDTLTEDNKGPDWWDKYAPDSAKIEFKGNLQREQDAGFTPRSDNPLDYVTFGQLGDIIRANYSLFGGILSNQKAMGRVMFSLNNLRGPIAHCGLLAEDEVDRLKLTVKDWFRLLEGPK
ncbi:Swt1 family HEPN domain-containing protein [Methylopila henanensis]|uniref:Swt1 family HEPN domain-containing protein n=1 Tax=Methylopila henanensis TaxID=873516 RepID=A0ABW4K3B6_9HYPH